MGRCSPGSRSAFASQNAMLTLPLLLGVLADRIGRGVAGALLGSAVAFGVGVAAVGGAAGDRERRTECLPGRARFAGGRGLCRRRDALPESDRRGVAAYALLRTFIYPWDSLALGGVVTGLAALGSDWPVRYATGGRSACVVSRHAALSGLSSVVSGHDLCPLRAAAGAAGRVSGGLRARVGAPPGGAARRRRARALGGCHRRPRCWPPTAAKPVRPRGVVKAMQEAAAIARRRCACVAPDISASARSRSGRRFEPQLPSPPRREWLELVRYWRDGGSSRCGFSRIRGAAISRLIDPQSRADRD